MTEISESLRSTMKEFAAQINKMKQDPEVIATTKEHDDLLAKLEETRIRGNLARAQFQSRIEELEASIKTQVLEIGVSTSHDGVEAKYRSGYTSETYPVKDVRKILLSNPAILPAFNAISVIKEIAPSVSVSYKAPEDE